MASPWSTQHARLACAITQTDNAKAALLAALLAAISSGTWTRRGARN